MTRTEFLCDTLWSDRDSDQSLIGRPSTIGILRIPSTLHDESGEEEEIFHWVEDKGSRI